MLREDNAALRLMEVGHELGLINDDTLKEIKACKIRIDHEIERIKKTIIKPDDSVNQYLQSSSTQPIQSGTYLDQLLKRAELGYEVVEAPGKGAAKPSVTRWSSRLRSKLNTRATFKNSSMKLKNLKTWSE